MLIVRLIFYTLFFMLFFVICYGQNKGEIKGRVIDNNGGIREVSILLQNATDSSLIKSTVSDSIGNYKLTVIPFGTYNIIFSNISYKTKRLGVTVSQQRPILDMNDCQLASTNNILAEVSIKAEKPLIERTLEGLTFNVNQSLLSAGENGFSLLKSLPGVIIDGTDNLLINGRSGVSIYVDGKPLYLDAELSKVFLRSISSSNIESIQLVTSPSAKYEAQGSAAIIDVKLKKNKALGFNGDVSGNLSASRYVGGSASINMNYKLRNVNIFATYNYNYYPFFQDGKEDRQVIGASSILFRTNSLYKELIGTNFLKTGVDWDVAKNQTISLSLYGSRVHWNMPLKSTTNVESATGQLDSIVKANNLGNETLINGNANINYKWIIDTTGKQIIVNLDHSNYNNNQDQDYSNMFFLPDMTVKPNGLLFNTINGIKINISAIKVDLSLPLKKSFNLDIGLKSSFSSTDNDFLFLKNKNGTIITDSLQTNRFVYNENIIAGYVSIKKKWKNWGVQIGLRTENTNSTAKSITINNTSSKDYWKFFPSLFLQRQFASGDQVNFSYTKRISRPDYRLLNPFNEYSDPFTIKQGNPLLQPEIVNSYEVSYTIKSTYFFSLRYSTTSNAIKRVPFQDTITGILTQTVQNVTSDKNLSLSLSLPVQFTKWLSMNNNFNAYYQHVKSYFVGGSLDQNQISFNGYSSLDFKLPKDFKLELSGYYTSPFINSATYNFSQTNISTGIRKSFMKNKLSATLRCSDIFQTNKLKGTVDFQSEKSEFVSIVPTRTVSFSVSYNFAKGLKFSRRQIETGAEEERDRTGKQ